ncbi:MAG: glycosyl transferase family 2 [Planctomycetaceae bacterium]|nr:glycosyl transferase family 2 [Planctomycetaceae bacterium]
MDSPVAIILAAGKSTRMKSDTPKVLHEISGRPMIEYVLDAVRRAGVTRSVVVVGHKAETVKTALSGHDDVEFALQAQQHGTGHAVMVCGDQLADHDGPVLVVAGDTPLLSGQSLAELLKILRNQNAVCVIGTAVTDANEGLGRIVRSDDGRFECIVEQKDATPQQAAIREINTGCFAFDGRSLFSALARVRPENSQAEYYLTDCPEILKHDGRRVLASNSMDIAEAMGVNIQEQLADVETILRERG